MPQVEIKGTAAFRYIAVTLAPGETIVTESGAMASMTPGLDLVAKFNGGFVRGVIRKLLGDESLFVNHFKNNTQSEQELTVTSGAPGDIRAVELRGGNSLCVESGAYIMSTPGVTIGVRWAGIASFVGGEGLFKLVLGGEGTAWYGGYGAIVDRKVEGEYIVDSGHLIAYDPSLKLKMQLSNGIFGSLFGGEGLVTRVEGSGNIQLQTRSIGGLASWLNRRF